MNRDFPFDQTVLPYRCLQTETSRALQLLYTHNMLVATITFHGGMRSISYEWGDYYNHGKRASAPDYEAMKDVASLMNRVSGTF